MAGYMAPSRAEERSSKDRLKAVLPLLRIATRPSRLSGAPAKRNPLQKCSPGAYSSRLTLCSPSADAAHFGRIGGGYSRNRIPGA
jgi:hypothetical protein